jgi:predicted esterase
MQKVIRVYKSKADALALANDLDGLRQLLQHAREDKAPLEAIDHISRLGTSLKEKGLPAESRGVPDGHQLPPTA